MHDDFFYKKPLSVAVRFPTLIRRPPGGGVVLQHYGEASRRTGEGVRCST